MSIRIQTDKASLASSPLRPGDVVTLTVYNVESGQPETRIMRWLVSRNAGDIARLSFAANEAINAAQGGATLRYTVPEVNGPSSIQFSASAGAEMNYSVVIYMDQRTENTSPPGVDDDPSDFVGKAVFSAPVEGAVGVRRLGESANVKISISDMRPNSTFRVQNVSESSGRVAATTPEVGTGSNGAFEVYSTTKIPASEYNPGFYRIEVIHEGYRKTIGRFKILEPVTDTGGGGGTGETCPTKPNCPAGKHAEPVYATGVVGAAGGCPAEWVCVDNCLDPNTEFDPVTGQCVPIDTTGGGGGGTGNGGGGGSNAQPPTDTGGGGEPTSEGSSPWLWVLLLVGGVLILKRRKN